MFVRQRNRYMFVTQRNRYVFVRQRNRYLGLPHKADGRTEMGAVQSLTAVAAPKTSISPNVHCLCILTAADMGLLFSRCCVHLVIAVKEACNWRVRYPLQRGTQTV